MTIRTVDPVCRVCRKPLSDVVSRHRRVGPDCWAKLSAAQQAKALALAAAERDPFRIPPARPPSATARLNNANARRAVQPGEGQLCHHEFRVGACPECRREADPTRAAERVLSEVRVQSLEARREERRRVLVARYAHVTPWRASDRPYAARTRPGRRKVRPARSARPTGQMELL